MKLSENFTLEELLESQTARRKVIQEQFAPSENVKENLRKLCINVLQPLRDGIGKPIHVTSGYRCKRLNKAIGGAVTSQHTEGKAADLQAIGYTNKELFDYIKDNLKFDQLLWEFGTKEEPAWVHVSFDDKRMRNQVLYIGVK
jgi:zinc D-Ala-D-Ala carboxypeptidase